MPSAAPVYVQSRRFARLTRAAVLVGCGVAVAGCNGTVETVRSLRGINKNDPDPVTAPFTGNMAAAEAAPYPNLASVPPPPSRATTAAERQSLTEKLVAERAAALAASGVLGGRTRDGTADRRRASGHPRPNRRRSRLRHRRRPASRPPGAGPAPRRIRRAGRTPAARLRAADAAGALAARTGRAAPGAGDPAPASSAAPGARTIVARRNRQCNPATAAAAAATRADCAAARSSHRKPGLGETGPRETLAAATSGPTTVATLDTLDPGQLDPAQITRIVARYRERLSSKPPLRAIRVISYTAMPEPGADPLGGYHDALERARGIAKVLTEAGIPRR